MSHTDLIEEILENVVNDYLDGYGGKPVIDFGKVKWDHTAYMNDASTTAKRVTEDIQGDLDENVVQEYFKATTNMTSSWKINKKSYDTKACIKLSQKNRFQRTNGETGNPSELYFPHIGDRVYLDQYSVPLSSGQTRVVFQERVIRADLRVRTFFRGNVVVRNGHHGNEHFDVNTLLDQCELLKTSKNGQKYFESEGEITIKIRQMQG